MKKPQETGSNHDPLCEEWSDKKSKQCLCAVITATRFDERWQATHRLAPLMWEDMDIYSVMQAILNRK